MSLMIMTVEKKSKEKEKLNRNGIKGILMC